MQALKAEVVIEVPENMVLVDKVEYLELKEKDYIGKTWTIADLKRELNIKKNQAWITECILKPNIREISDWCFLKEGTGGRSATVILASKAKKWFDENWSRIDWSEKL